MRTRFAVRCERCKGYMPIGTLAIRVHGRIWHLDCATEYARARRARRMIAA